MGVENSRIVAGSPQSWRTLQRGIHYSSTDVAVWPHLFPLVQWFTPQDALALNARLNQRTTTSMLTFPEFVAWLQNGRQPEVLHRPAIPQRHDIMTPPAPRLLPSKVATPHNGADATLMLEMYLEHVFHTFSGTTTTTTTTTTTEKETTTNCTSSTQANRIYAMEFLATMVILSRAIWSFDEKVRVLMELFHDPSLSARHSRSSQVGAKASTAYEKCFKETDLAQLFLCAMRGISKATIGVGGVWEAHGFSIAALARSFAVRCINDAIEARKSTQVERQQPVPTSPSKLVVKAATDPRSESVGTRGSGGITEQEFHRFVASKPVIRRFLALFACEELRNPFTFSALCSPCAGVAIPDGYRRVVSHQNHVYNSLLGNYVTFDGREEKRQQSAIILIQSTWRRRRSRSVLERYKTDRIKQRDASAATLQNFLRRYQFAKVLEHHADAERRAFNGGLFIAGSGPCIPRKDATTEPSPRSYSATGNHPGLSKHTPMASPLKLIETFKLLNVRLCSIATSQTCALALSDDRQTLFAWGRCLPCVYQRENGAAVLRNQEDDDNEVRLFQLTPARLAYRFKEQAVQVACGLRHALVLTGDRMVYSWGFNDHGQLGHGPAETLEARTNGQVTYSIHYDERVARESEFLPAPTRLMYFQGSAAQQADPIPIQQICCGEYYSMALSHDGDVFTWGEASEGQLGHGDAHHAFQVAFADLHMLNSAYTFLSQPEPVLALSDDAVAQIACRKNHSVALTTDGRVFEWGSWGKRRGRDMEHAFTPVEMQHVKELRLRRVSVGDHHTVGEGSSVWMTLASPTATQGGGGEVVAPEVDGDGESPQRADGFGVAKHPFYLACTAYSCSFESIEKVFAGKARRWTCSIVEFDVDDLTEDQDVEESADQWQEGVDSEQKNGEAVDVRSLWRKRVQQYALTVEQVGRFDARNHQLCLLSYRQKYDYNYDKLLTTWLNGHVDDRFVVFPKGKAAGVYIQFLIPSESASPSESEQRDESEQAQGYVEPSMVEFNVCGSSTSMRTITKRGLAVHAFHPGMEDSKLTKLQRKKKKKMSVVTEENSLFIIEFDDSCLPSAYSQNSEEEAAGEYELSGLIVGEMTERVLAAQESGALAVLLVLDLFDMEPFELQFEDDSGVYIPVLMTNKYALAVEDYVSERRMSFHNLLEQMLAPPPIDDGSSPTHRSVSPSRFVSRPIWTARCFKRVDTLGARVQCALANGASGVILIQDRDSTEMDGETKGAPIFHSSLPQLQSPQSTHQRDRQAHFDDRLIAMISYEEGVRLRASSHMSLCQKYMPLLSKGGCSYELLVDVQLEIRPGGTTYAWGNAQNGRSGVGLSTSDVFQDGYEALTDTSYRYLERPTPLVTLAGMEMRQLECGNTHTLAVTTQGKVFAWGRGTRGALAQSSSCNPKKEKNVPSRSQINRDLWVPKAIHGLRYENIVQVAANDSCSMFVTEIVNPTLYHERRRVIAHVKAVARKSLL